MECDSVKGHYSMGIVIWGRDWYCECVREQQRNRVSSCNSENSVLVMSLVLSDGVRVCLMWNINGTEYDR